MIQGPGTPPAPGPLKLGVTSPPPHPLWASSKPRGGRLPLPHLGPGFLGPQIQSGAHKPKIDVAKYNKYPPTLLGVLE